MRMRMIKSGVVVIRGYSNYAISEKGTIFNDRGFILSPYLRGRGYPTVDLYRNGIKSSISVHVAQMESRTKRPQGKNQVNHIDHNKENAHYLNLEFCDNRENGHNNDHERWRIND